jgi:flagellar capping protein FliD
LADTIETNVQRIGVLDSRLESERTRLLKQFFAIEEVVARMQSDLAAIQGIQAIAPLSISLGQRSAG